MVTNGADRGTEHLIFQGNRYLIQVTAALVLLYPPGTDGGNVFLRSEFDDILLTDN